MDESIRARAKRAFWERHANPASGWSRTLTLPALLYAVYHRRWRLLVATVAFTLLNPVLFSPPDDADAWMTKVVLAERQWRESGDRLGALQALNVGNGLATLYAVYAAYRRDVGGATVAGAVAMTLKLAFVDALVRRYGDEVEWPAAPPYSSDRVTE
ncbi:hypothetical protein I7X12_13145 [Halosimplex litoreum]|uniref:Uncharacterized protein n=1 Tax=Halosimplex litoreum TaxID=1198301 RepID=A0A7T3KTZ0_9EURY|nr:DUF6653 family protein [Halosimplex litoreum]QPV61694.1 hypothetical protein I7X12_13145 [Halosimplex litoreum]